MPAEHPEYLELLPWYVNGTLPENERAALERHLGECLPCNAALREERRLGRLIRSEAVVPLGPEYGIGGLMRRIDRKHVGGREIARVRSVAGYGLAAAFGAAVVWLLASIPAGPGLEEAAFSTLSTVPEAMSNRIDVVFEEPPDDTALARFAADISGVLVSGPSAIGRYTFAVASETDIAALAEELFGDPRVAFAGRSYIAEPGEDQGPP